MRHHFANVCTCNRTSELFCVVLCTEAVHSHKHTYIDEQFLQFSGLGFVTLGTFQCA